MHALVSFNAVPTENLSAKYTVLGSLALKRLQDYGAKQGLPVIIDNPDCQGLPACWQKLPLILDLLAQYEQVTWVDSDAMPVDLNRPLPWIDSAADADLISQCPAQFLNYTGWPADRCRQAMPLNSGIFTIRATSRARALLEAAWALRPTQGDPGRPWDGLGDQEALIRASARIRPRIAYAKDIQSHPKHVTDQTAFAHFFGNHAVPLLSEAEIRAVTLRWHKAITSGLPLPQDLAVFHIAMIQSREAGVGSRPLERFGYQMDDLFEPLSV